MKRSGGRRALFVLMPLFALLLVGECTGRVLERTTSYRPRPMAGFIERNPYMRGALVPNSEHRFGDGTVQVGSLGFRGEEVAVEKPEGVFRIVALGGSTTFGWKGVPSHTQAWPYLLEQELEARTGRDVEVINAGVPGWSAVEARMSLLLRVLRLEPDAVLIYQGNNDINWSYREGLAGGPTYSRDVLDADHSRFAKLLDHSYVFLEIRSRLSLLSNTIGTHDEPDPVALDMLRWNLEEIVTDTSARGVRLGLGTFAHAVDESGGDGVFTEDERALGIPNMAWWFENLSVQGVRASFPAHRAMVTDVAQRRGVTLVDIRAAVPPDVEHFVDWCHLTAKGHEVVARAWADGLIEAGWFEPPAADPDPNEPSGDAVRGDAG